MKIETSPKLTLLSATHARVTLEVFVDGIACSPVTVVSGPKDDVLDFYNGHCTLVELTARWDRKNSR